MLLAIPVEGFDPYYVYSLVKGLVFRVTNFLNPLWRLVASWSSRRRFCSSASPQDRVTALRGNCWPFWVPAEMRGNCSGWKFVPGVFAVCRVPDKDCDWRGAHSAELSGILSNIRIILWRRGSESNRRIKVLQTSPLPLGYRAPAQYVRVPCGKSLSAGRPSLTKENTGAGDGGRTRDIDLGKVALYH